jgi:hypothetical protein
MLFICYKFIGDRNKMDIYIFSFLVVSIGIGLGIAKLFYLLIDISVVIVCPKRDGKEWVSK